MKVTVAGKIIAVCAYNGNASYAWNESMGTKCFIGKTLTNLGDGTSHKADAQLYVSGNTVGFSYPYWSESLAETYYIVFQ